jgi:hypothetical protein
MNRQAMIDFAQRVAHARDNDARIHEIVKLAPSSTLSRFGLAHQPSALGTFFSYAGAVLCGAIVGAGAALLLAPSSGEELRADLRTQADRLTRKAKSAADRVEHGIETASSAMDRDESAESPHYGTHA